MKRGPFCRRVLVAAWILALFVLCCEPLSAQRVYSLDATFDAGGGVAENPQELGSDERVGSISFTPALSFTSRSPRTSAVVNYAFGWDRLASDPPNDSSSHNASLSFTRQLNPRTSLKLSNGVSFTNDPQTFLALRGVLPTDDPSTVLLVVDPVVVHQNFLTETVGGSVDRQLSPRASISLGGSFYLRDFRSQTSSNFSDQRGGNADVTFVRQISERSQWNIGYSFAYYSFDNFESTMTNVVRFGFSSVIAKDTILSWGLGASHAKSAETSNFTASYEGTAGLAKSIKGNTFSINVSQDNGHPSGFGSVSRNRVINVGVDRKFNSVVSVFASATAFDSKGVLDNDLSSRGTSATGNIGFAVARNLTLHIGAQYHRYTQPAPLAFAQKRVFASLRYALPNLLHSR